MRLLTTPQGKVIIGTLPAPYASINKKPYTRLRRIKDVQTLGEKILKGQRALPPVGLLLWEGSPGDGRRMRIITNLAASVVSLITIITLPMLLPATMATGTLA